MQGREDAEGAKLRGGGESGMGLRGFLGEDEFDDVFDGGVFDG